MVLPQRPRAFTADAAAASSARGDPGGHDLDRRRADWGTMSGRSERLASAGQDRGQNVPVAPRSDLSTGARRPSYLVRGRFQDLCGAGSCRGTRRDRRRVDGFMSKLVVSAIGPVSSVQDGGRYGAQRYGLTPSGAMDRLALAAANCMVGNAPFAAAIEIGPVGAPFTTPRRSGRRRRPGATRNARIPGRCLAAHTPL